MPTPHRRRLDQPVSPLDLALGLGPVVAGLAVGLVTSGGGSPWYRRLAKPSWTPAPAAFGPVWTVLYLLMGLAAVLVHRERGRDAGADPGAAWRPALALFGIQLVLNLAWSLLFFRVRRLRLAAAELGLLWLTLAATIAAFLRVRVLAALLLLPYLAWTTFAGALNIELARRNPRA